jgi:hypothetical protein
MSAKKFKHPDFYVSLPPVGYTIPIISKAGAELVAFHT